MTGYVVITQHGLERKVRRTRFADFDAAVAFATATDPDTDPSLCPNIDDRFVSERAGYEWGAFWFRNRYAAILRSSGKVGR